MKKTLKKSRPAERSKLGLTGEPEQPGSHGGQTRYVLSLYISGSTLKSTLAVENIKRICEQHLKDRYDLEVIDIYQQPNLAREEQIVAVPTSLNAFRARCEGWLGTCRT